MKPSTFTLAFIIMMFCLYPSIANADINKMSTDTPESIVITFNSKNNPDEIPDNWYLDPRGRRTPPKPIIGIISSEGLQIPGIDTTEIYLYEVYDSDGKPMASFTEMYDFIDYIFGATETIEIRLHIDGYMLFGYIYL